MSVSPFFGSGRLDGRRLDGKIEYLLTVALLLAESRDVVEMTEGTDFFEDAVEGCFK